MNRGKDLVKNTLILSIGTFLPKLAAIITIPIITSHLTKVEYGTYDLLATLAALLLPIVTLQIHSGAFRFLIDYRENLLEKKRIITNIYLFLIPISIFTLIILYIILYKLKFLTRLLVVIYFFVDIFIIAIQQIVRGLSKNKLYSASAVVQSIVNTLLIVLFVGIEDIGLNGVLTAFIFSTTIGIIILLVRGEIVREFDLRLRSKTTLKQILSYSWPMIPNTLSSWVLSASDRFVLTGFMGVEAVAIYAAANKIPQLFTSVQGTFIFAWQENASLALKDDDVEKYYSNMYDNIFCILSGVMSLLIGVTPILFWLLIKGDYDEAYPQIPILFMAMFFSTLSSFLGGIYVAHKRTKDVGITTMLAAVCNLIINLVLVHSIGIYAASISTLVSYSLLAVYRIHDIKKFQKITYKYRKISLCVLSLTGMCILCWINNFAVNIINLLFCSIFAVLLNQKLLRDVLQLLKNRLRRGKK